MTRHEFFVDGMTCEHCVRAVTSEVSAVDGVDGVEIDLRPGEASLLVLTSAVPLDGEAVRAAVDEAGYDLRATS